MTAPKRFLVTGGSGFLGAALVRRLLKENHTVKVLDNGSRSSHSRLDPIAHQIELIQGDIRDPKVVHDALRGIDSVIHLAAINGTEFFYNKASLVLDVGVRGMLNVLDGCVAQGIDDLVIASSSEVYQTPPTIPTDETAPLMIPDALNPRYSYAGSKIISELLGLNYGRSHLKRVLIFRPHNVYGPDMGEEHVLPQFIRRAIAQIEQHKTGPVPFPIQGDGRQTRSFIHIDDMTDAIICLINRGEHLNIYHVGNPEEVSVSDLAKKILYSFGREALIEPSPLLKGSTERRCPNIDKIKALGFSPKISLENGLPSIISWYQSHHRK